MRLKYSLILVLVLSTVIPLLLGFYYLSTFVTEQHREQVEDSLEAITKIAKNRILSSVDRINDNTALVSSRTQLRKSLLLYQTTGSTEHLVLVNKIMKDAALSISNIKEISVFDAQGIAVATTLETLPTNIATSTQTLPYIALSKQDSATLLTGYDLLELDGESIGIIKVSVEPNFINEIVQEGRALGETGEWVIAIKDANGDAVFVSHTRYKDEGAFNRVVPKSSLNAPAIAALYGNDSTMWDAVDYAGNRVVAATRNIDGYDWGIVAKINKDEVFKQTDDIVFFFALVLLCVVLLALIIAASLSYFITKPIESLAKQVVQVKDNPNMQLNVPTHWTEVRLLVERFNEMLLDRRKLNDELNDKVLARTQELASTNNMLFIEKQKAEDASKAKSMFLANMSHELRTPLNSIHGSLQLLAREDLGTKPQKLITTASYSMQSLLAIINDILDYSKIDANAIELEHTYFDFKQLVAQVTSEMDLLASKKGILLSYEIADNYTEGWLGDAMRIKQVLVNFVSNAIKFTEKGTVVIQIGSKESSAQDQLVFSVKDTGCGMSPEFIEKLFDRFSQADSSTTRKFGGTGLGMPICLGLVNIMDGEIKVTSVIDQGSTVTTTIPLQHIAATTQEYPSLSEVTAPDLSGVRILLAEDNEINQVIFCSMLEETKATVTLASNGQEALARYHDTKPDIIFLDIHMPVMDGIEACKAIRQESSSIPLVSITANISPEDTQMYSELGFDYHVGKPVDLVSLYQILRTLTH